jgi:alpha-mannosidase
MVVEQRLIKRVLVAEGPLQLRVRSQHEVGEGSTLYQDIVFHSTTPRIDFETAVDWDEKHKLLKASFDLEILADFARHEIQYGHVERPTHRNLPGARARFEVCAHKWTDLSENGFGVALLNDCKYGIGVQNSSLRLSLLKAGTHPDERGDNAVHRFTYSLLPHAGGFSVESVVRPAYELNVPLTARPAAAGVRAPGSLLTVDAPNVIVECVKWAEKERGFVVRLYEAGKTAAKVCVQFGRPVRSVSETNMLEENPRALRLAAGRVRFNLRPFEIKTLLVRV